MNGIKADAGAHLASLSMENPEDIDRIYYYKAAIETCEGVINYSHRIAARAANWLSSRTPSVAPNR